MMAECELTRQMPINLGMNSEKIGAQNTGLLEKTNKKQQYTSIYKLDY